MKVLIVDDTKTPLSLIQIYLMGWGLEFVEAHDGLDGLSRAAPNRDRGGPGVLLALAGSGRADS